MAYTRARQYNPHADWGVDSKNREVNALGQHKIRGYSPDRAPSRGFGGLNEFYLRQNNDGTPKDIERAANDLRTRGRIINSQDQRKEDNWENRGFTTARSGPNPYPVKDNTNTDQYGNRLAGPAGQAPAPKGAGPRLEAGDGQIPGPGNNTDGLDEYGEEPATGDEETPASRTAANPYSRAGNIENAKAAGEFDDVRNSYNAKAAGSGYQMDEDGTISPLSKAPSGPDGTSEFARETLGPGAEDIRARRDFARGEAPVTRTEINPGTPRSATEPFGTVSRVDKMNPYGTATAIVPNDPKAPVPRILPATTQDYMGHTVPMNPYLKQQSLVQDTKFGSMTPGSQKPLGQDDADSYRRIARGGKIPSTKTAA